MEDKMERFVFHKRGEELIILPLDDIGCLSNFVLKPSICLLFLRKRFDKTLAYEVVNTLIKSGAIYFVTYGPFSEELHDLIDEIVESPFANLTHIVTVAMQDEEMNDLAWFFLKATCSSEKQCRYIALFDDDNSLKSLKNYFISIFKTETANE